MSVVLTKKMIESLHSNPNDEYTEQDFANILLQFLENIGDPDEFKYEESFKESYAYILSERFHNLTEVETISLTKDDHSKWRIDIVIKMNNQYIPIELKFRQDEQSINGYAADFVDDVHRINELIDTYDDIPCGYAICLTNNVKFTNDCNQKIDEYDKSKKSDLYIDNIIVWHSIKKDYQVGIVGRFETENRRQHPTNKSFTPSWNNKKIQ